MTKYTCDICGQDAYPHNSILTKSDNGQYIIAHIACYEQNINKCVTCANPCAAKTDNTIPQYITKVIRQGPMIVQAQVLNPQIVDKYCAVNCQCWDGNNCMRQTIQTCQNYKLIMSMPQ